jgi:predicted nuclease of predicted toxin-antitoxin system
MIRFLADENFNNDIVRSLQKRMPDIDILRVQDVGLRTADDPTILEWAARDGRVVLTHDAATTSDFAYDRVSHSLPMPGVFVIKRTIPFGVVIDDLLLVISVSFEREWEGRVVHLPL